MEQKDKPTVLVVDDDAGVRRGLYWALTESYHVLEAVNRPEACAHLQNDVVDVVLSDLRLPPAPEEISEGLAKLDPHK